MARISSSMTSSQACWRFIALAPSGALTAHTPADLLPGGDPRLDRSSSPRPSPRAPAAPSISPSITRGTYQGNAAVPHIVLPRHHRLHSEEDTPIGRPVAVLETTVAGARRYVPGGILLAGPW